MFVVNDRGPGRSTAMNILPEKAAISSYFPGRNGRRNFGVSDDVRRSIRVHSRMNLSCGCCFSLVEMPGVVGSPGRTLVPQPETRRVLFLYVPLSKTVRPISRRAGRSRLGLFWYLVLTVQNTHNDAVAQRCLWSARTNGLETMDFFHRNGVETARSVHQQ